MSRASRRRRVKRQREMEARQGLPTPRKVKPVHPNSMAARKLGLKVWIE